MKRLYIGVLWMVFSLSILQAKEIKMSSPDEKYQFTLSDEGGNLHYSLNWNAKETINHLYWVLRLILYGVIICH